MANKKNSIEAINARRAKLGKPPIGDSVSTTIEPTAEDLKRIKESDLRRKKASTKRTQEALKAGDLTYEVVPFLGAKMVGQAKVQRRRIRTMLIPTFVKKEGEVRRNKAGVLVGDDFQAGSKAIKVAYGFKLVRRKAETQGKRGGSQTQKQTTAWITLSVPSAATFEDVVTWCNSFRKVPKIIRMGRQQLVQGTMGSAGANI